MASHLGGIGPLTIAILWVLTALAILITLVRLYTRSCLTKNLGLDDLFAVLTTVRIASPLRNL